jgi:hypothetical protein
LVALFGAGLCAYALLVALSWYPMPWLSRRVERVIDDLVDEDAKVWYLAIVLGHFALDELALAIRTWSNYHSIEEAVRDTVTSHLIGFSVDSFLNALWASLWPIKAISDHGLWPTVALGGAMWLVCRIGTLAFGETNIAIQRAAERERQ